MYQKTALAELTVRAGELGEQQRRTKEGGGGLGEVSEEEGAGRRQTTPLRPAGPRAPPRAQDEGLEPEGVRAQAGGGWQGSTSASEVHPPWKAEPAALCLGRVPLLKGCARRAARREGHQGTTSRWKPKDPDASGATRKCPNQTDLFFSVLVRRRCCIYHCVGFRHREGLASFCWEMIFTTGSVHTHHLVQTQWKERSW